MVLEEVLHLLGAQSRVFKGSLCLAFGTPWLFFGWRFGGNLATKSALKMNENSMQKIVLDFFGNRTLGPPKPGPFSSR